MSFKPFDRENNELGTLFKRDDGNYFQVIGYILDPAIILEPVGTSGTDGHSCTVVINSLQANTYRRLVPEPDD